MDLNNYKVLLQNLMALYKIIEYQLPIQTTKVATRDEDFEDLKSSKKKNKKMAEKCRRLKTLFCV